MQGRHTFEYALTSYRGTWREAGVQALAHGFCYPPLAFGTNEHQGSLGRDIPLATFAMPGVVPSALHRSDKDGAPILRVFNASGSDVTAAVAVPAAGEGAELVDLMDQPAGEVESSADGWLVPLREWQIASLRFGRR